MTFIDYFLYFMLYSFLGYICEVVYVSVFTRKITNRGFLYSPICPIYGSGAIIIILLLNWAYNYWYLVFILGVLLTSLLEYITSYFMELIFHTRWWDYSHKKFNIQGRVCLLNSILFGLLVLLVIYLIHPFLIETFVKNIINVKIKMILFYILLTAFILDGICSIIKHINFTKLMLRIEILSLDIENKKLELLNYLDNIQLVKRFKRINHRYPSMKIKTRKDKIKMSVQDFIDRVRDSLNGE